MLVVTQRDGAGGCLHNHLVASSVSTETGDSLNSSVVMHARLVETHEAVLEREGFHQPDDLRQAYTDALDRRDRGESSRLRRAATKEQRALVEATRHAQWVAERATAESGTARRLEPFSLLVLKHRIDSAVTARSTTDWATFVTNARTEGVTVERADRGSDRLSFGMMRRAHDRSFRTPTASDRRRGSTIGEDYTAAALERRIASHIDAMTRSARVMTSVLTAEDEREVEARMAIYWAQLESERATPVRERKTIDRPAKEVPSATIVDVDPSDSPTDASTSDPQGERDLNGLRVELEHNRLKRLPAPVSAGANDALDLSNPGSKIEVDYEAPLSPPPSHTPEKRGANPIAEARRRRLRRQAIFDFDPQDDTSTRVEGELEL